MYYIWVLTEIHPGHVHCTFSSQGFGGRNRAGGRRRLEDFGCVAINLPEPLITLFNIPIVPPFPLPPLIGSYSPPPYSIGDDWSPLHSPRKLCDPPKSFLRQTSGILPPLPLLHELYTYFFFWSVVGVVESSWPERDHSVKLLSTSASSKPGSGIASRWSNRRLLGTCKIKMAPHRR